MVLPYEFLLTNPLQSFEQELYIIDGVVIDNPTSNLQPAIDQKSWRTLCDWVREHSIPKKVMTDFYGTKENNPEIAGLEYNFRFIIDNKSKLSVWLNATEDESWVNILLNYDHDDNNDFTITGCPHCISRRRRGCG